MAMLCGVSVSIMTDSDEEEGDFEGFTETDLVKQKRGGGEVNK